MEFTKDFLANKIFRDQELNYDSILPYIVKGSGEVFEGAVLQPNGDYLFRIKAPNAQEVKVTPWFGQVLPDGRMPWAGIPIYAEKNWNGVFECTMPYDEKKTGPRHIDISIDGTDIIWPYLPVVWTANRMHNFVEVPDPEMEFIHIKDVPHGAVCKEIYWSKVTNEWERCLVYLPPGYMKSNESYPVLYLLHGGTENETVWTSTGRANFIIDNLLAQRKCVPFIIVMNNGMLRYDTDKERGWYDLCFEDSLINCGIPYIEANYRVKADKWNRAIAGLSMGSYQSNDIGFRHPELFSYMANFTSTMYSEVNKFAYERNYEQVVADPETFMKNYKVFFSSATPEEDHLPYFMKDNEIMKKTGLDKMPGYRCIVHGARTTRWNSWRMGLRDYAQLLFR
jgi:enterochelin esterase family protein